MNHKYTNTVRADWLDPVMNTVGNLFEDIRGAQQLFDAGEVEKAQAEADAAAKRFLDTLDTMQTPASCEVEVQLLRIVCHVELDHPNGGEFKMSFSASSFDA
jgi:hypothetical protein